MKSFFRMPNQIITDNALYYSTKRVFAAMLAYCDKQKTVRKSVDELAQRSGCSAKTVQQALDQLTELGYISKIHNWRYSRFFSQPVFDKNTYQICRDKLRGAYTKVPRSLLGAEISHAAFVVAMGVYMLSGAEGRSYGSLNYMAKALDMAKATVCRAMEILRKLQLLVRLFCRKANRALAANSYYPTDFLVGGSLIFTKHKVTTKITEGLYYEGNDKGVFQFGNFYKKMKDFSENTKGAVHGIRTLPGADRDILPFSSIGSSFIRLHGRFDTPHFRSFCTPPENSKK